MTDMWNGKGSFSGMSRSTREALWTAVLDVIDVHQLTLFMMVIDKAVPRSPVPR